MPIPITPSRFQRTDVLMDGSGRQFFGLWRAPKVILYGDESTVVVTAPMAGQLDLFAFKNYGNRDLFWIIALANGIIDIAAEVVPGLELKIPKASRIAGIVSQLNRGQ